MGITYHTGDASTNWPSDNTYSGSTSFSIEYDSNISVTATGSTSVGGTFVYRLPPPRRMFVEGPKGWTDADSIAFAELVNSKTNTGWKITALIKGDILIMDPSIEKRTMADFIPLLLNNANGEDKSTIVRFFEEHKI